jgi:hypothetical protein
VPPLLLLLLPALTYKFLPQIAAGGNISIRRESEFGITYGSSIRSALCCCWSESQSQSQIHQVELLMVMILAYNGQ